MAVQLVLRAGVRQVPAGGPERPRLHHAASEPRGPVVHPPPQGSAEADGGHLHRSPRHRDRQERQRGRGPAPRAQPDHRQGDPGEHQRDQAAELDAKLVAQSIAEQLENRVSFRRAMKRALTSAMRSGAQGVKVQCSGRLGGAEMSRSEHTRTAVCRCTRSARTSTTAFHEAKTTFGRIGVKVWINRGEVLPEGVADSRGRVDLDAAPPQQRRPRRDRRDGPGGGGPGGGGGRPPGGGGGRPQGGGGGRPPGGGGGRPPGGGGGRPPVAVAVVRPVAAVAVRPVAAVVVARRAAAVRAEGDRPC